MNQVGLLAVGGIEGKLDRAILRLHVTVNECDLVFELPGDTALHEETERVIEKKAKYGEHNEQHGGIEKREPGANAES